MTSYEFEKAAKNAVVKVMQEKHNEEIAFKDLQLVWFAHELGYKKCTLYAPDMGNYYAEVTYNWGKDEMYVDVYLKKSNTKIPAEAFDFEVKE